VLGESAAVMHVAIASAVTVFSIPELKALQVLPFHFATRVAATIPPALFVAAVKSPPTYTSVPDNASAYTQSFSPKPTPLHPLPSHFATRFT